MGTRGTCRKPGPGTSTLSLEEFLGARRGFILIVSVGGSQFDEICEHVYASGKIARRLGNGVVWGSPGLSGSWGDDWEQTATSR